MKDDSFLKNFFYGIGYLNIFPDMPEDLLESKSDEELLASDWVAVGKDMCKAMEQQVNEQFHRIK